MATFLLEQLSAVCPECDALNPPRSTRCIVCSATWGKPRAAAPPAAAAPPSTPARPTAPAAPKPSPKPPSPPAPKPLRARPGEGAPPGMRPSAARPPPPAPPKHGARPSATTPSRYILGVVGGPARGQRFRLMTSGCWIGRSRGAILFPDDVFVSPQHAAFFFKGENLLVRDEASLSGIYVSIPGQELIGPGACFSAGDRAFRFTGVVPQAPMALGRPLAYGAPVPQGGALFGVEELLVGGRAGRAVVTAGPLLTIGQRDCDFTFPEDPSLSPRHCEITLTPQGALLRDLSGEKGTFVRLAIGERSLRAGDRVRIGQQILQVETAA